MNLRERESGKYKGQTRLAKKGRPMLRKVLGQAVFPVLRGDRLLGARYAERRERMVEQKARVAAMRKLLATSGAPSEAVSPSTRPASTCARASTALAA